MKLRFCHESLLRSPMLFQVNQETRRFSAVGSRGAGCGDAAKLKTRAEVLSSWHWVLIGISLLHFLLNEPPVAEHRSLFG